jgi:sulfate permease, SulP family
MTRLLFESFDGYHATWARRDVTAGLTVWAVLVPESLAYATIAGVPPVVGLYGAVPALVLYALLGSSRHLVVAPMSATAALSAGVVGAFAAGGTAQYIALTTALAIVMGLAALAAGLLRLGFVASLISEPVLKGFIIGLALTIIAGQLPELFGVPKGEGDFFEKIWDLVTRLDQANPSTLVMGACSLALVLLIRRWLPLVPGALVAVVLGVLAVGLFDLEARGVELVGDIDPGLPALGLPPVRGGIDDYLLLAGPALGVMLVGFAEGLGAAKTYAARDGDDINANQELMGLGIANLGSGLASGMVSNGSLSKTAVNAGAGARSQLSSITTAALTLLTLLFLTGLFEQLPLAVLAGVVIAAVIELVDVAALRSLYLVHTTMLGSIYRYAARADFIAALAALLGVLVFDTLPGLFIGIGVSLLLLLARASRPNVATLGRRSQDSTWVDQQRHQDARPEPRVLVIRVESGLFFANADNVRSTIQEMVRDDTRWVVLDAETVPFIDVSAATMLTELTRDLRRQDIKLLVAQGVGQVRDIIRHSTSHAKTTSVYPTVEAAIEATRRERSTGG